MVLFYINSSKTYEDRINKSVVWGISIFKGKKINTIDHVSSTLQLCATLHCSVTYFKILFKLQPRNMKNITKMHQFHQVLNSTKDRPEIQRRRREFYRRVDEVEEVLLSVVAIKQGGRLGLHSDPSLPLHLKLVQNLLVLLSLCDGSCFPTTSAVNDNSKAAWAAVISNLQTSCWQNGNDNNSGFYVEGTFRAFKVTLLKVGLKQKNAPRCFNFKLDGDKELAFHT